MYSALLLLLAVCRYATGTAQSCVGRCSQPLNANFLCQCNTACKTYKDCCEDYDPFCLGVSCVGRCGAALDASKSCQCNTACVNFGDCCSDYNSACNGGGGGSNPPVCDMSCLAQKLWDSDLNKISLIDVNHNYQAQTTTTGTTDAAPGNFFVSVNENHFNNKPTFKKFIALLDNYNRNIGQTEDLTTAEWAEIDDFLDTALQTEVMQIAYGYLVDNGVVSNAATFRETLKELWFNPYPRSSASGSPVDSSGFEHAMVGETRGTVSGFHSWIQFYLEEKKGNLNYLGWVKRAEPEIMGAKFTWHGEMKTLGSFFMRTSPEFDVALYSVCALTKPNAISSFTMAGHNIQIQTWDVAHKAGAQIGSSYPAI